MIYLHSDKEQFQEAINLTYEKTGVMIQAIEKDYYVTMLLQLLAKKLPCVVFKGGTSLSKCYEVIQRFSEDIDITVDINLSQGQKKKVKQAIVDSVAELGMVISNLSETRSRRDYNRYEIMYDSVIPIKNGALKSMLLLETSYTAVAFPTARLPVYSYIGKMMKEEAPDMLGEYRLKPFEMKVQGIERTLVDKIFALCDYYLQGKVERHSRHLYDIYKLLPLIPQDEGFRQLVKDVRKIRAQSVICPSALPEVNVPEVLEQIVKKNVYKQDYEELTMQLLEEQIPYEIAAGALEQIIKEGIFSDPFFAGPNISHVKKSI